MKYEQITDDVDPSKLEDRKEENKMTINLISRMLGASVLTGAFVVEFVGLVPALILMVITVVVYCILNNFYIDAMYYTGSKTFREVTQNIFGKKLAVMFDYIIIFLAIGTLTSYLLISSRNVMSVIYKYIDMTMEKDVFKFILRPCIAFCLAFPLTLLKNTKQLSFISPISVSCIALTVLSVVAYFIISFARDGSVCDYKHNDGQQTPIYNDFTPFPDKPAWKQLIYFTKYIPTLQFTFNIETSFPIVFQELKGPLQIRRRVFKLAISIAFGMSILFYSAMSFFTAINFGTLTKDNVIETFSPCGFIWMDVIGVLYGIVLIMAYPLVLQPPRVALMNLIGKQSYGWYVFVGFCYVAVTCLLSCVLEQISSIFGLFSAICGFFLYFLVPLCGYLKMPTLKLNANIPSIQSQLKSGERADNVVVALVHMLSGSKVADKARDYYSQKKSRAASIAVTRKDKASSIKMRSTQRSHSLIHKRIEMRSDSTLPEQRQPLQTLQTHEKPLSPKFKRFDYSKEYTKAGKFRRAGVYSVVGVSGVLCAIAFTLNLMDFIKK